MADQIKEYVIKIRADVKDALAEINKLSGKFDKIELKSSIDKGFEQQLGKVTGHIGKITEELSSLKSSFKEIGLKDFTSEIKTSFQDLQASINEIQESSKVLSKTFDFSDIDKDNQIFAFVNEFKQQMQDMLNSYQAAAEKISEIQKSGFTLPKTENPSVLSSASQISIKDNVKQQKEENRGYDEYKKLQDEGLKSLQQIVAKQKERVATITELLEDETFSPADYDAALSDVESVEKILKTVERTKQIQDELDKLGLHSKSSISSSKKQLRNLRDQALDAIRGSDVSTTPTKMRVRFDYDILATDDEKEIKQTVDNIVQRIQNEVQNRVQNEINQKPIRIPISFGSYELIQKEKEESVANSIDDQAHGEGIIRDLHVAIKANTEGLLDGVNQEIENLNSQITSTINVKVKPILPDKIELGGAIGDIEAEAAEQIEQGIQINLKDIGTNSSSNENIVNVLNAIKGSVDTIASNMGKIQIDQDSLSKITFNPNVAGSQVHPQNPTIQAKDVFISSDRTSASDTVTGNIADAVSDGVKNGYKDSMLHGGETGSFDHGPLKPDPRKPGNYLSNILPKILMRGRKLTQQEIGYINANQSQNVRRDQKTRFATGMDSLRRMIESPKSTLNTLMNSRFYTGFHEYDGEKYAHFGRQGESLSDFQKELELTFNLAKSAIKIEQENLQETIQNERKSTGKVDSGINGQKVLPWMKRIIDADIEQERIDTRSTNARKRLEKEGDSFARNNRQKFQAEVDARIVELDKQEKAVKRKNDLKNAISILNSVDNQEDFIEKWHKADSTNALKSTLSEQDLHMLSDPSADFNAAKAKIISSLNEIADQIKTVDISAEEIDSQKRTLQHQKNQYANMSDTEIAKEVIRREHSERRSRLASEVSPDIDKFDDELKKIEEKEMRRIATRTSREMVRLGFGQNAFKKPGKDNVSRVDVGNDLFKGEGARKRIDKLEKAGYFVDENTGNLYSMTGKVATTKPEASGDLIDLLKTVGEQNQERLNQQMQMTDVLSQNEDEIKAYIGKYQQALSTNGEYDVEVTDMASNLYDSFSDESKDYFSQVKQALQEVIRQRREQLGEEGVKFDDVDLLTDNEKELYNIANALEAQFQNYNPTQVYEIAQQVINAIQSSKKAESDIRKNTKDIMTNMVERSMKRPLTEEGYIEANKQLEEVDHKIVELENRMSKAVKSTGFDKKTGKNRDVFGFDVNSVTDYEQQSYWDLKRQQKELRKQRRGYEIANGLRDYWDDSDDLSSTSISKRVTSYNLPKELQFEYAKVPSSTSISQQMVDQNGIVVTEGGRILREAVGVSSEQLQHFASVLDATIPAIEAALQKFPQTEEEIDAYVQGHINKDIESMKMEREKVRTKIRDRFADFKEEHADEFENGDQKDRSALLAQFKRRNRSLLDEHSLISASISDLRNDTSIRQQRQIDINNTEIQDINSANQELSQNIISLLTGNGDESQRIIEQLHSLSKLRERESATAKELSDYYDANVKDKYDNNPMHDKGYVSRLDYLNGIKKQRGNIEKGLSKYIPNLYELSEKGTTNIGAQANVKFAAELLDRLINNLNRVMELESENLELEHSIQADSGEQSVRKQREKTYRENLEAQRNDLLSAKVTNAREAANMRQLDADTRSARAQEIQKAKQDREIAKQVKQQRDQQKIVEINAKLAMPKEEQIATTEKEYGDIISSLEQEKVLIEQNRQIEEQRIKSNIEAIQNDINAKKLAVANAQVQAESSKPAEITQREISDKQQEIFRSDEKWAELFYQKESSSGKDKIGFTRQLKQRESEIIEEYAISIENELYDTIDSIEEAINGGLGDEEIKARSAIAFQELQEYKSITGKDFQLEGKINGQDTLDFIKQNGDIESQIYATKQEELNNAQRELQISQERLSFEEENLRKVNETARDEKKELDERIRVTNQEKRKEIRAINGKEGITEKERLAGFKGYLYQKENITTDVVQDAQEKKYDEQVLKAKEERAQAAKKRAELEKRGKAADLAGYNLEKSISPSAATSREDFIDRIKKGINAGLLLGVNKEGQIEFGDRKSFKEGGYKDVTSTFKAEGDFENFANKYYKVSEAMSASSASADAASQAEANLRNNRQQTADATNVADQELPRQEYNPEEEPDYDVVDNIHAAFGEVAESTKTATIAEQNLGDAREKTASKSSQETKDAISLSKATSREDFINRAKLGIQKGYLLGTKKDKGTQWFTSQQQMDKYGYSDATKFLKTVGGKYGSTDDRYGRLADTYYKEAQAAQESAEQTNNAADAEKNLQAARKSSIAQTQEEAKVAAPVEPKKTRKNTSIAAQRDFKPYTADDFKDNTELAQKVARQRIMPNWGEDTTKFWQQSKANAIAYLATLDSVEEKQKEVTDGLSEKADALSKDAQATESSAKASKNKKTIEEEIADQQEKINSRISEQEKSYYAQGYSSFESGLAKITQQFKDGEIEADQYRKKVDGLLKGFNQFKKANPSGSTLFEGIEKGTTNDAVIQRLKDYISSNYKMTLKDVSGGQVSSDMIARFNAEVVDAQNNVQKLRFIWDQSMGTISVTSSQAADQFKGRFLSLFSELQAKSKQLFVYWTATFLNPYRLIGSFKQVINIVKEYDDALTEMRKVSDESISTLKQFQKESFGIADSLGTTAKTIQNSTADWLRLGESFDEAKKSAEVSNLLLNVSEFTSIDDATQSLVSASQAYKDLDKIEIVDKLNNIGNNFSVSTDQLAKGLQNAAAVLHTQGNDIDQSLALLTAGNAITQDISKTSAGIRTISLRISGTEEAKNEIQDMGEDIDDFVVRTKSKTDQIIRDYTAVASNSYKGVSVLDDNGNLRDTYDILLDIAKIYKEIQQEDKLRGTNRAQALVEQLAGKNRSNIAASILENPELLQNVYNASQKSTGSAMVENQKYLDSVSGKMQQMQNHLQEMANIIVDSDGLKVILDIVNNILSTVTKLVDQFGGLNTIIGSIAGITLQKKGFGANNWNAFLSGMFAGKPSQRVVNRTIVKPLSDYTRNIFGMLDLDSDDFFGELKNQLGIDEAAIMQSGDEDLINLFNKVAQSKEGIVDTKTAYMELGTTVKQVQVSASESINIFSKLGTVFSTIGSTFVTVAASMAAMFVISEVIKLIYDLATAQQRAIEAGKEAQVSISKTAEGYRNTVSSISEIKNEYAKLSEGVDSKGKNVNLSTEEYDRFLELSGQIAEIAPELVTGYDAQGNAIVALGNNVDDVNGKFQEYLNLQRDIANADIGSNLDTVFTGIKGQAQSYNSELEKANQEYQKAQEELGEVESQNSFSILGAMSTKIDEKTGKMVQNRQDTVNRDTNFITVSDDDVTALLNLLSENGIYTDPWEDDGSGVRTVPVDLSNVTDKTLRKINGITNAGQADATKEKALSDASVKKYELLIDNEYKKIIPSIQEYINTSPFFDELDGEELQKKFRDGFNNIFSNFDYQSLAKDIDEAGGLENFIDDFIFTMLANDDTKKAFEGLTDLAEQQGEMTVKEYREARSKYYKIIQDAYRDSETGETLYSDEYLDGIWGDDFGTRESNAAKKLGLTSRHDQQMFWDALRESSMENEDAALTAIEQMSSKQAKSFSNRYNKIMDFIQPYLNGEKLKSNISPTDTLSTLINDESYKSSTESLSSDLSSLTGALETLRTEGSLTAEQMVELQNSFPDLTEFTTEAIQTKAFEKLDEWISKIREGMKGMSEEGKEQARIMIQNMIDQYGDLGLDYQDVKNAYWDLNGHSEMKGRTGLFDAQVEELRSRLESEGLELDTHVLYTLVASDQFSGTADEIYNKYNNAKLNWEITFDKQKLEEDINKAQNRIENSESSRELKEANGEVITSADYAYDLIEKRRIAKMRRDAADDAKDRYNKAIGPERAKYLQDMLTADTEANKAEADLVNTEIEAAKANANEDLQKLESSNTELSRIQNQISEAEKDGGKASAEMYEELASEQENQSVINKTLGDYFQGLADSTDGEENSVLKTQFQKEANDYYATALQNEADAMESRNNPTLEEYNKLQTQSEQIQREITKAEQNHQKVSEKTYDDLINNGKAQIRNLQKQQSEVDKYSDKWWDLQNSIDSMSDSIYEWDTTSKSLIYDQASQLASAISSAMSESISETGLTDDTINALKTAFSDLDGSKFDVSDAFYSTADGVKVNTKALQELTEAEFELIGAPLANEIANVQAQLEKDPGNSALQDKLENLMETNAKYFAQYEEMQKALSRNAAIDLAEGTEDAGANYDKNYGRVKTYKEAREKGLIGTDDFKAWTSYLDVYGRDTLEAYDAVSGKIDRYFTENAQTGLGNFLTDMEKLGYAAQDADGYWQLAVDDYDAAAKDMQMGSAWFMDTLRKLEDYGMVHTYVSSLNEAQLKTRDVEEQIADAVQTYSEMVARGASDEELQKQIDHINELGSSWQDLDTVTKTWDKTTEENRKKEFLGLDDQLTGFQDVYKNAKTNAEREAAKKAAQDYVKQFRMTLNEEDLAKGVFKLSDESAEDYASRITEFSGSMENPLTAEDMGISEENVDRFDTMRKDIQELAQSGDLANIQDSLSGITAEQLRSIDYDDGKYTEGFEAAEGAVDQLREQLGLGVEDTDLLIDAMTALGLVVDQKVDLPTQFETLDNFLANATKGSGAGYQINTDVSRLSVDELNTQLSEIQQLELDANLDPDSEIYTQLKELEKQTKIQLNIKNSDQTQSQLREWAEAGNREEIAKTFGIDVNSDEVDQYIQQINNMLSDYDLVVHVDDTQFSALIEAITGEPYQAEVEVVGKDKVTSLVNKLKQRLQSNPITQPIVQKVQQFGQKIKEKVQATVGADTSNADKGTEKVESNLNQVNKSSATAQIRVDTSNAMSGIGKVKSALSNLSNYVSTPRISVIADGASLVIAQIKQAIDNLRDKTVTLTTVKKETKALGTAHYLGTTSLSRAYADGKDWTVGKNEKALVNEIGQESRVRDGVWELIPGGPHVEDLRKNDIIFSAEQTADLIRTGKTARRGKLVAHANGTVNGMPAHAITGLGSIKFQGTNSVVQQATGAAAAVNSTVNAVGKASKSTKKNLDKFKKWLEKLFDWIEVRLDRIQRRIDLATAKAETAIGNKAGTVGTISSNKNSNLNNAMKQIAKNVSEFDSTKLIFGKNGQVTGYKGGTGNTLLGDSVRGALRYQQQANKVAQQAWKNGLFGKDKNKMNNIIARIQNGTIDISEYNEKIRAFIDAYKEWYDKSQDLVQSTAELKKQYNDLQQQKLDNIVDEFETLVGLSEAVKASSEATVEYYKTAGRAVGTKDEEELENQRDRQGEITKILTSQISAFKGELVNAEKVFGKNSNEYREAQTKLEEMNKSLIESQTTELELAKQIRELSFTIRGHFITRVKSFVDKLGTIASLAEKRGTTSVYGVPTRQTEDPYMEQTRYNNELILKYYEDIKDKQKEIQEFNWEVDSDQYEEAYNAITSDESAILSLLSANEDLKDSIRSLRWKPYEELNKELDDIVSDLQHVNSFIRDGEILDDDGQITERGYAQIALIAEQMDVAEQKIRNANAAMEKLGDERDNDVISTEEYNEALDEQIKIIQDASSSLYDDQTKLADIYIDQITKENDILQDLIQSRKEALSAKKEYYDYDKTLRSKNKDIAQLQAQINALQGVTNDAAIAKRTKLQAELAEKQEDLNDTLYNHSIDLQQEGYDKLSEDMQTALDNAINAINGKFEALQSTAASMLTQLQTNHVDEATIINGIVTDNATALHTSTTSIINELSGEDGVKKLIEGLGVKLGDIATLDIAGAINSRTPDSAVSNINTILSTVQNSLGEDIKGDLREIELSIGTLKLSEEQKNQINSEIEKLEGIDNKTSDIKEKIDKLKEILEQSDKTLQTISGNTAKGDNNVGGNVNNNSKPKTEKNINPDPGRQVNQNSSSGGGGGVKQNPTKTTNTDPVMAAIQTGTKRSNKVTKDEEKKHHALWTFLVKNTGYAPTNATYTRLAAALGVSIKNKNKITSAEKDNILKKLKKYETPAVTITNSSTTKPVSNQMASGLSAALTTKTTTPKTTTKTTTTAKADPILAAINSGKARSKTVTAAEKKEHGDLWEYVAKKYGRSLTNAIMGKLAGLLNVKVANKSKPTTAEKNAILKKLKAKKYAKGTKNISKDLLAWTNEDWDKIGSEMIVRPSDGAILTPLKAKDSVIPANLADNLFKWGAISPDKFITNPFVGKWSAEGGGSVTNNADYTAAPQTVEMHFDSLFHIEGNVDESVMPRLENLGKSLVNDRDFQKNVIKFVTKDFVRESKKQGIR